MSARWRTGLVVLGAVLALAGCSPDGADGPAADPGSPAPAATVVQKPPKQRPAAPEPPAQEPPAQPQDSSALDAFVAAQQSAVSAAMDANPGVYSQVTIEAAPPATIVFGYVYAEAVDGPTAAGYLDTLVDTLQAVCDAQVFPAMVAAGVTDPQAVYTYRNPDGSEIWSRTFAAS